MAVPADIISLRELRGVHPAPLSAGFPSALVVAAPVRSYKVFWCFTTAPVECTPADQGVESAFAAAVSIFMNVEFSQTTSPSS